jgi:uncharacterized protein YecT (DUF1311 family)
MAIDNPDAPDYIADFEARVAKHEKYIFEEAATTADMVECYVAYEADLDAELNNAYRLLMSNVEAAEQELLKASQRQWIQYRDKEFSFIGEKWNAERFGSSSAMSAGSYRTTIIKSRVLQLVSYLQ